MKGREKSSKLRMGLLKKGLGIGINFTPQEKHVRHAIATHLRWETSASPAEVWQAPGRQTGNSAGRLRNLSSNALTLSQHALASP